MTRKTTRSAAVLAIAALGLSACATGGGGELTASSECGRILLPTVMMVDIVRAQINAAMESKGEGNSTASSSGK